MSRLRAAPSLLPALAALVLSGCGHAPVQPVEPAGAARIYGTQSLRREMDPLFKERFSDTRSLDVLFATNRNPAGDPADCDDRAFGVSPAESLTYGACTFNAPKRRKVGSFEAAPHPRADPHQYHRALGHAPLDEAGFLELLGRRPGEDVLVFIHGFNVRFQEALLRAAQIAYDLKFQGPVVLFSWPAGAREGLLSSAMVSRTYAENSANALKSVPQARSFFKALAGLGRTAHVMVHSMGHQVALRALTELSQEVDKPFIGELILNAPDFPVRDFQKVAPDLKKVAERVTVYCSYNDNAIAASESYNRGRRMGACERAEGVDTINVGEIDAPALGMGGLGHGYYSGRPILTDIYQTLLGVPAEHRLFIRRSEPNSTEDYYLRP
jgi:esterase/lipase superfamily enzyme